MADLYFFPMACSLASRIAASEAGIELNYHHVNIFGEKELVGEPGNLRAISAMAKVPVLVLDDGTVMTENIAVLQAIADLNPESGLAPPPADRQRLQVQQWLSFVATELHKGFCYPTYSAGTPDAVKAWVRAQLGRPLDHVAAHLADTGDTLVGHRFTIADAYLAWALLLIQAAGVHLEAWPALSTYLQRVCERPLARAAIELERGMWKAAQPG